MPPGVLGHWRLDGESVRGGVFTLILRRTPAGWKIIHDHTSSGKRTSSCARRFCWRV
ncbi:MAG: hypothetical protein R3A78_06885 [Polyangiales bacterium]